MKKICRVCGTSKKSLMSSNIRSNICRKCDAIRKTEYRKKFPDKVKESRAKHYKNNSEKIRKRNYKYKKNNLELIGISRRKYFNNKFKNDPIFKLHTILSKNINAHLKIFNNSKNGRSLKEFILYTIEELSYYIESLFEPWMNWSNRGAYNPKTWNDNDSDTWTWQLDHIKPISHFKDIIDENSIEFKECWSLKNLRPLSAKQNQLEGNKRSKKEIKNVYSEIKKKLKGKVC